MPTKRSHKEENLIDLSAYTEQLKSNLRSPEGQRKLKEIRECSQAALRRFEQAENVDSQLLRTPMTV